LTLNDLSSYVLKEVDLYTKSVSRQIIISDIAAYNMEIIPSKELIYIGNANGGQVAIINASSALKTLEYVGDVKVAKNPSDMVADMNHEKIYLINNKINRISIIDTNNNNNVETIILNTAKGIGSPEIAIDSQNKLICIGSR